MRTKRAFPLIPALAVSLLALAACKGDRTAETGDATAVSIDAANSQTISSYFSIYAYGPTQVMYDLPEQKAVLKLTFPNENKSFPAEGKLFLFGEEADEEAIGAWKNNQYSDAIFTDAAEPDETVALGKRLEVLGAEMTGSEHPRPDQSYDVYQVRFRVADVETDRFTLKGFEGETTVYVMMEGKRP